MPADNRTAVVARTNDEDAQALIATRVAEWRAQGAKVVGVIAAPHGLPDRVCRAGTLHDIASGRIYSIYLETPPRETSCHLDAGGVETACKEILGQIAASDLVVLSKFGKLEALGEGLAPAFHAAISAGKPVLTTISGKHRDAWEAFARNTIELRAEPEALQAWWESVKHNPS